MKSLMFNIKAVPSIEKYTIEDMPAVTAKELNGWIEEVGQKLPNVTSITSSMEYVAGSGILDTLVEMVINNVFIIINKVYDIPLSRYPTIAIYKLVEEDDESKVIAIVGYAVAFEHYRRLKP